MWKILPSFHLNNYFTLSSVGHQSVNSFFILIKLVDGINRWLISALLDHFVANFNEVVGGLRVSKAPVEFFEWVYSL